MAAIAEKKKAQETKPRGEVVDYVRGALRRAGERVSGLTPEQRTRALEAPERHPGLRGAALVALVMDGADLREQEKRAAQERQMREADEVSRTRSAAAKAAGSRPPSRRAQYPDEIREAVRLAQEARGTTSGSAGPKQHVHVREVVGRLLGDRVIRPGELVAVAGAKSLAHLGKIAAGEAPREDLKPLRRLGGEMGDDAFCKGRSLAAILVAWSEQLK